MSKYLGVKYLYEDDNLESNCKLPDNCNVILTSEDLSVMPPEWIASLRQAALEVDADLIFQLVDRIPPDHTGLARGLAELAQNFCFDEIIELTQGKHRD